MNNNYENGKWETVKIDKFAKCILRSKPKASIGYNRIYLNESACALIKKENSELKFAKLLKDEERNIIGIKFQEKEDEDTIKVKERYKGVQITSKENMEAAFGEEGIQKITTEYEVKEEKGILILGI